MSILGVVVPIYNKGSLVRKCIESLLEQELQDIEIVLVDDGSTDESGKVADEYALKDTRIRVVHQDNKGPIIARYKGLKELDSKYATFVDADDWIDKDTYQALLRYMKSDVDVIEYSINRYYNESKIIKDKRGLRFGEYNREQIEKDIIPKMIWDEKEERGAIDPSVCNKIMKRDLLIEEYEKASSLHIHYGEDLTITYPILYRCDRYAFSGEGAYYHRRPIGKEVALYLNNQHFFSDLSKLYEFLLKQISKEDEVIVRQLDDFFSYAVQFYMQKYDDKRPTIKYMFPFHEVQKGAKIVLYGAGKVGRYYREELSIIPYCTVVLWVDKKQHVEGVSPIDDIFDKEYDYIVVAVKEESVANEIKEKLLERGVPKDKIVWSFTK